MIFRPGLDPAGAVGTLFLFPERRARLELIHQILRRIEGRAAMRRRRRHKDYRLADAKRAPAMHCEYVLNGKERAGLRSEERRAGKGWVSKFSSRWWPYH